MPAGPTFHYLYDPFCGWCYGAAPLVKAARSVLPGRAHGGGMWSGRRVQRVTSQLRNYVVPQDRRIGEITGQPFGHASFDGLWGDPSAVFDSTPPIAAMLAAEKIGGRGLDMIARLQMAHYVEGRRIAERQVLAEMASAIGLDANSFGAAFGEIEVAAVHSHIAETRRLMAQLGAGGFPSIAIESDGEMKLLPLSDFFGRPQVLQEWLTQHLGICTKPTTNRPPTLDCSPDGCLL